jgi:hypothetical protein
MLADEVDYVVGVDTHRDRHVPRGGNALFVPSYWRCVNFGSRVECTSGDAYPWVELTATTPGGVTVKVHTLRDPQGGGLKRTYVKGYPVYTFTAF